jgi:uncharacterized membrane protein YesL
MFHTDMMKIIFKKIFWCNFDYLGTNILYSLLWNLIHLPAFAGLAVLIFSHHYSLVPYIVLYNLIWLSPFTAALFHATGPMVNSGPDSRKMANFFKGLKKYWFRAVLIFAAATSFLIVVSYGIVFYIKRSQAGGGFLMLVLAGLLIWVAVYYILMQFHFFPVLILQDEKPHKVIYKAFLLVLSNPLTHILFLLFILGAAIIASFSVLGFILLYPAFYTLSMNIFSRVLLQKYNPLVSVEEESRTFRNLLKPWE